MEIQKYLALIWHWAWLIVLGVVGAAGVALLVSLNTTPVFSATAQLLIDQAAGDGSYGEILRNERLSATYVELIKVDPVLNETIQRLELPFTTSQLSGMVSTSAPLDTQLLNIRVVDTDAERGSEIANTLATVFVDFLAEQQGSRFETALARFDTEAEKVANEIQRIETEINTVVGIDNPTPENAALLSRLETQLREQQEIYNQLFNDAQTLRIEASTQTNNVVVVENATPGKNQIRPQTLQNTILAAAVGGMIALGFIFLIDFLDNSVKSPTQVQEELGLSSIGVVSFIKSEEDSPAGRLITHHAPRAPISEAFRMLRTNLEFSSIDEKIQRLIVTSPSPGEGKSTTTANLATVLAQSGNRVILIDSDLRRPSQHKIFDVPNNQGLTTALLDSETPVSFHWQNTIVPGLRLMTSGPLPPNPAELLNSQRLSHILDDLHKEADIIIIDTPPILTVTDAAILAPKANGVVLVAQIGSTALDALAHAAQIIVKGEANLYGIVLNRATSTRGSYYNYYYRNYTYDYGDQPVKKRRWGALPSWLPGTNKS
ncbi:MAG: polysaccharide biosynthesis tyrosine autokinase [Ardenticatenaceae bacterium]|nr:polysaccharide biosynthesis tyrosine autokinase [Ardenticatenaceae bacterium]